MQRKFKLNYFYLLTSPIKTCFVIFISLFKMFGYACDRCREKHQSCNHETPCIRCIKVGIAELCHYTPKRSRSRTISANLSSPANSETITEPPLHYPTYQSHIINHPQHFSVSNNSNDTNNHRTLPDKYQFQNPSLPEKPLPSPFYFHRPTTNLFSVPESNHNSSHSPLHYNTLQLQQQSSHGAQYDTVNIADKKRTISENHPTYPIHSSICQRPFLYQMVDPISGKIFFSPFPPTSSVFVQNDWSSHSQVSSSSIPFSPGTSNSSAESTNEDNYPPLPTHQPQFISRTFPQHPHLAPLPSQVSYFNCLNFIATIKLSHICLKSRVCFCSRTCKRSRICCIIC